MRLDRKGNKAVGDVHAPSKDIATYLSMLIDVFAATSLKRDNWLSKTEKDFYIATIVHLNSGYTNPISEESVQIYRQYFKESCDKIKISDYLNRLRTKKWLKYDKNTKIVEIPLIFMNIGLDKDVFDFNIRLSYEK